MTLQAGSYSEPISFSGIYGFSQWGLRVLVGGLLRRGGRGAGWGSLPADGDSWQQTKFKPRRWQSAIMLAFLCTPVAAAWRAKCRHPGRVRIPQPAGDPADRAQRAQNQAVKRHPQPRVGHPGKRMVFQASDSTDHGAGRLLGGRTGPAVDAALPLWPTTCCSALPAARHPLTPARRTTSTQLCTTQQMRRDPCLRMSSFV